MHLNELKYHAADLVRMLPEQTLARMATSTKVDCYSKVLQGVRLFNLLLYALVFCKTMSQRKLEKVCYIPSRNPSGNRIYPTNI